MPPAKKDPTISALEAVHAALKPLDAVERQRVLSSVYALLEISEPPSGLKSAPPGPAQLQAQAKTQASTPARPVAIRELIQEKKPRTHPQFITLFAYYREKHQNLPTFSRADLEQYYTTSRETPPKNFDRDFVKAVKRGWLHEDADSSYITSKGLELVESNFSDADERPSRKPREKRTKRKTSRKAARSKENN